MPESAGADAHAPVLIVGAGACGLTAALMLHDAGITCAVIERDAVPSGSSALSSGFIPAPTTLTQRNAGVNDSVALFAQDIQAKAKGTAAPHLVAAYAAAIGPAMDALALRHGLAWELLDGFLYPGHSVRRMHAVPEKTGAGLMNRLSQAVSRADIPVLTGSNVRELWLHSATPRCSTTRTQGVSKQGVSRSVSPSILGIGYETRDGAVHHLGCDALLLACNGFGGNADMVRTYLPDMANAEFAGHLGNDGSAIAWGQQLPARLADLGGYQGHGSWAKPHGGLVSWALMMEGGVQINAEGQRFHDETQGYSEAAVAVLAQPGGAVWNVIDERLLQLARSFPDFVALASHGAVKRCADVVALAACIGCPVSKLNTTLQDTPRLAGPFYAIRVTGALFHTQGGLDIDAQCRVLQADGDAFPNLLAAGGAARGVSGNAVWGYLSGNGLLSAVAGAYIAAKTVQTLFGAAADTNANANANVKP
jgi:fumarate reductase flavoprotein subunit